MKLKKPVWVVIVHNSDGTLETYTFTEKKNRDSLIKYMNASGEGYAATLKPISWIYIDLNKKKPPKQNRSKKL